MTLAALQMLVGVPYVWGLWLTGLRKAPRIGLSQVTKPNQQHLTTARGASTFFFLKGLAPVYKVTLADKNKVFFYPLPFTCSQAKAPLRHHPGVVLLFTVESLRAFIYLGVYIYMRLML